MKKFLFDCGTRCATASLGILFLRVCTGLLMFFGHGLEKLQTFADKKDKFPVPDFFPLKYMSSPVSLTATVGAEVVCSMLLVFGLFTRPAAFIFAFTMTVAAFGIHGAHPWFSSDGPSKEMALLYLVPAVAILLSGAGKYSLDATILKEGRRRSRW